MDTTPPPITQLLNMATKATASFEALGLGERSEVIVGDMFESVPKGGDVYILTRILHDWNDERATSILQNCRHVMTQNARLLIIEPIVSEGAGFDDAKLEDITMMFVGGEDRTEAHLLRLLDAVGFRKRRFLQAERSGSQCLEAVPV